MGLVERRDRYAENLHQIRWRHMFRRVWRCLWWWWSVTHEVRLGLGLGKHVTRPGVRFSPPQAEDRFRLFRDYTRNITYVHLHSIRGMVGSRCLRNHGDDSCGGIGAVLVRTPTNSPGLILDLASKPSARSPLDDR